MRIDAHQHFWRPARGDYEWLTPHLERLYDDFLPKDLAPVIARNGIERTILVQAAPSEAETRFLLGLAGETPFVAGVVGWSDFEAPEARVNVSRLAADPLLVGLRPMVQDLPDDDWLAGEDLDTAFDALAEHGLVFDALLKPRHIPAMLARLARSPDIPVVIDHAAKPDILAGDLAEWRAGMVLLAQHENVVCKLSGLVTEAGPDWSVESLRPVVDDLLAAFGPQRLLWGSDWPVLRLVTKYDAWVAATDALLAGLAASDREAILGGNAERIYLSRRGRRPRREPASDA
jgi:L-fuconolactonase